MAEDGVTVVTMYKEEFILQYIMARYAAYRNVWWSLANEYDLMPAKTFQDWEHIADAICACDPYQHLRSIHNCVHFYDHRRPWITQCSIQRQDIYKSAEIVNTWRQEYRKPVVLDEICYEGDIQHGWGNISGQELVRRFWEAAVRGGYPGHGETFLGHNNLLWWSHGDILYGESHKRFAFLHQIMYALPGIGLRLSLVCAWDEVCGVPEFSGTFRVQLPAKPYMAVQIKRL